MTPVAILEMTESVEDRVRSVLTELRPYLQTDGGDLELVGINDGVVSIRMNGACSTCPSSMTTLKEGIERRILEAIPEIRAVVAVNLEPRRAYR